MQPATVQTDSDMIKKIAAWKLDNNEEFLSIVKEIFNNEDDFINMFDYLISKIDETHGYFDNTKRIYEAIKNDTGYCKKLFERLDSGSLGNLIIAYRDNPEEQGNVVKKYFLMPMLRKN